jgi:hypothetical protein
LDNSGYHVQATRQVPLLSRRNPQPLRQLSDLLDRLILTIHHQAFNSERADFQVEATPQLPLLLKPHSELPW